MFRLYMYKTSTIIIRVSDIECIRTAIHFPFYIFLKQEAQWCCLVQPTRVVV